VGDADDSGSGERHGAGEPMMRSWRRGKDSWAAAISKGRPFSGCLAALLAVVGIAAGPSHAPLAENDIEKLRELHFQAREQVRLVQLPVIVTTKRGRVVQGLGPGDFMLYEDYVPQVIRYFGTESDQPISIAFLLDVSGSMRQLGKLDEAKEAIRVFINSFGKDDRFGLVCFADDQVAWVTEFTSDVDRFLLRLSVQEGYGQTAIFDAIAATPRLVDERIKGRKAIVLITDGIDNASRMSIFDAIQLARSVNVPIYTIGFSSFVDGLLPKGSRESRQRVLERFSEETGGLLFSVNDPDDLKEAVLKIQQELRFQYVIGYHPVRRLWDGSFRRIKLEAARNGLIVRTRTGYYANP
jgi:Ca-activated chloride channel family protein